MFEKQYENSIVSLRYMNICTMWNKDVVAIYAYNVLKTISSTHFNNICAMFDKHSENKIIRSYYSNICTKLYTDMYI